MAFFGHAKYEKAFISREASPTDPPPGAVLLDDRWGLCPRPPLIGSHSTIAMGSIQLTVCGSKVILIIYKQPCRLQHMVVDAISAPAESNTA